MFITTARSIVIINSCQPVNHNCHGIDSRDHDYATSPLAFLAAVLRAFFGVWNYALHKSMDPPIHLLQMLSFNSCSSLDKHLESNLHVCSICDLCEKSYFNLNAYENPNLCAIDKNFFKSVSQSDFVKKSLRLKKVGVWSNFWHQWNCYKLLFVLVYFSSVYFRRLLFLYLYRYAWGRNRDIFG